MSSESDGMATQQYQSEPFGFSSNLTIIIVPDGEIGDETDMTEVEDYEPILECFKDLKALNRLMPPHSEVVSVKEQQMAWAVTSQKALDDLLATISDDSLSKSITEFLVSKGIVKQFKMKPGLHLECFIDRLDERRLKLLKAKARKHFQDQRSFVEQGPPTEQYFTAATPDNVTTQPKKSHPTSIGTYGQTQAYNTGCAPKLTPITDGSPVDKEYGQTQAYNTGCAPKLTPITDGSPVEKEVEVILYVPENLRASCIRMTYKFGNQVKTFSKRLIQDKAIGLWVLKKIKYHPDKTFEYEFEASYLKWNSQVTVYHDEEYRKCDRVPDKLRDILRCEDVSDGYSKHIYHIASKWEPIKSKLVEIDNLGFVQERQKVTPSVILKQFLTKSIYVYEDAVLAYVIGKLEIQTKTLTECSLPAQRLLRSLEAINSTDLIESQLQLLINSAKKLCQVAFKGSRCVLPMMEYCFHLLPCSYFMKLLEEKEFTFAIETDKDLTLCEEVFYKLASSAMTETPDAESLLHVLVQHTPLSCVLKFNLKRYSHQMDKIHNVLSHSFDTEICEIKSTTNWNGLSELCANVSTHSSLVEKYSSDLTSMTICMLKSLRSNGKIPHGILDSIVMSPNIFLRQTDKEEMVTILSTSHCQQVHDYYLRILDSNTMCIESKSVIRKSACAWLETLLKRLESVRYETPADYIKCLYIGLIKLLEVKVIKCDSELCNTLKKKVCEAISLLDMDTVVHLCLQGRFRSIGLFFDHLEEMIRDAPKRTSFVETLGKLLDSSAEGAQSGMEFVQIGTNALVKMMPDNDEDVLYFLIQHSKLCCWALKHKAHLKDNVLCKVLKSFKNFSNVLINSELELYVIMKLDTVCKEDDYTALHQLLVASGSNAEIQVAKMKQDLHEMETVCTGVKCVLSVFQTVEERVSQDTIPHLHNLIEELKIIAKKFEIGQRIKIKDFANKSFLKSFECVMFVCKRDSYLWESTVFLSIFEESSGLNGDSGLKTEGSVLIENLCKLMTQVQEKYLEYWRKLSGGSYVSVPFADVKIIESDELGKEIDIAEQATGGEVPESVRGALKFAGYEDNFIDKIETLKCAMNVLKLDATKDPSFSMMEEALRKDKVTLGSLITANEASQEINNLLDSNTFYVLEEFSKSTHLLNFINEIKHEDLRNLIDAVEEHSEQSVQELTVSSLIDVRRFLRPLVDGTLQDSETVTTFLQTMHESIKVNKLAELHIKLKECNTNLHGLRSLYHNVANRGEVTKGIVKALIHDEEAAFAFKIQKSSKVDIFLSYKDGESEKQLTSNELRDYRSRALLLVNASPKEQDNKLKPHLDQFTRLVDWAIEIAALYEGLVSAGHPSFNRTYEWKHKRKQLEVKKQFLSQELSKWECSLENTRKKWYWLNHFYPKQLLKLKEFFSENKNREEIISLFQSAGCNPLNIDDAGKLYLQHVHSDCDEFKLSAIGATLDGIIGNNIAIGQLFPKHDFEPTQLRPFERVEEGQLFVIHWIDSNMYVIPALMTLYRNTTGRIPCHHQVLFCTEHTTWESIQLLLNRSVGDKCKQFEKQLYCVVHAEKLSNEVQFKLVKKLKELGDEIQYLAVICRGNINHPLVNHFSENIHKLRPMSNDLLSNSIQQLQPDVVVVTSDLPGQGKSEQVRCDAFNQKMDLVSLHVSGHVSDVALMAKLKDISLENNSLLHINIGTVSNAEEIDIFIFKLCILGFMSSGASIFPCSTRHIRIEIANSINDFLVKNLPTAQLFKERNLSWIKFKNLRVSQEVCSPVQVVCHYLQRLEDGTIDSTDMSFSGENAEKPLSTNQCRKLLRDQFSTLGELSFSVLNTLLNVTADQLYEMSHSVFLRTANLHSMVGDNTVRSSLLHTLIASSTEFATRSVGPCRKEQKHTVESRLVEDRIVSTGTCNVITATSMTDRVKGMIQWEDSNHLIIAFHRPDSHTLSALYREKENIPGHVRNLFETQMEKGLPDFSNLKGLELKAALNDIVGSLSTSIDDSYAMTPDNLLKMILIAMRIKAHVPVIVMGETGCGKTRLLRYLASVCDAKLFTKNMHAGIEEEDVTICVSDAVEFARSNLKKQVWLFFDEINTCDHLGLLNELLCHSIFKREKIPPNISIIAACNPYKLREICNTGIAGLVTKVKSDEQSKLVYCVHPLPERMVDYVWDYGSLTESDEMAYISTMVSKTLNVLPCKLIVDLLIMSQKFIRDVEKNPYCVSLRDVNRCRLLVTWFRDEFLEHISDGTEKSKETEAIIMALSHSYHSRLNDMEDRKSYRQKIFELLNHHGFEKTKDSECVLRIINDNQKAVLDKMDLPHGIAKNTALQENVFVILVCLLKHIPIFVVGKPGSSKSLSLQLLKNNLRGKDSKNDFFRRLPQLFYVSYQGSESSTSDGIIKVFEKAQKYREHNKEEDVLPVVILDEIGLAEASAFNPLKVLHSLLEPESKDFPDVAVVGVSNWALDPAKMNRAVHLSRPDMVAEELHSTAVSIAEVVSEENQSKAFSTDGSNVLKTLAYAYSEYVENQKIKNFHGLRDFYSLVKFVSRECLQSTDPQSRCSVVLKGLLRNFGGFESEIRFLIYIFNKHLKEMKTPLQPLDLGDKCAPTLIQLIDDNISDTSARHLMLLTRGDSCLGIVEDQLRLKKRKNWVSILGSCFEEDQTDHYSYKVLSDIIFYMEQGFILILRDLESIYGSLYDMLNQNYTTVGSKKNCRIALGAYNSPLCQVDDSFRCIVLVEEQKVNLSDPPFLNRFEKQRLTIHDVLCSHAKQNVKQLQMLIENMSHVSDNESFRPTELLPMYSEDLIPSLVHREYKETFNGKDDVFEMMCLRRIIPLCTPEGIIRAENSALVKMENNPVKSLRQEYFSLPIHEGLEEYLKHLEKGPKHGIAAIVFTHSSIYVHLPEITQSIAKCCQYEKLGSFKSEKQLSSTIGQFFSDTQHEWLLIQVSHTDQQHFLLLKSMLESEKKQHLSTKNSVSQNKNVVVIIHVDRTKECSQTGLVNFLSEWDMAIVDCLEPHIFQMNDMLTGSLADMAQRLLSEKGITVQNLFEGFACIHYTDQSRPIESIVSIIRNEDVVGVVRERIEEWISSTDALKEKGKWQLEVASNTVKLKNYLTFQAALLEEIKSTLLHPLAALIFTIEELHGWDCLSTESLQALTPEKLTLWKRLVDDKLVVDISQIAEPKGPECYPCRMSSFSTRFPFSMFFIHAIENLENTFFNLWRARQFEENDSSDSQTLELLAGSFSRHVHAIAKEMFQYSYGEEQFQDYMHDFCQWFTAKLPLSMSEEQMIRVFAQAISSRTGLDGLEFDMFVTKLHVTAWKFNHQFQSELTLIDMCLSDLKIPLHNIMEHTYQLRGNVQEREETETVNYATSDTVHSSLKNSHESMKSPTRVIQVDPKTTDNVAAHLVDLACKHLLPSADNKMEMQTVQTWQRMVNSVLPVTLYVSKEPVILQTLRACNDLASLIILPYKVSEEYFWDIGSKLSAKCLDAEENVNALQMFVREASDVPMNVLKHFLSSYASLCLMADTETDFVSKLFGIYDYCGYNFRDVAFLGSVLHHSIFLQIRDDPKNLLKDNLLENKFFKMLDAWLRKVQGDDEVGDTPLACVIVDLLQNHIFVNMIEQVKTEPYKFLDKLLELKRQYTWEKQMSIKLLFVIAYLKSALQSLAVCIHDDKITLNENLWQRVNQLFEGGTFCGPSKVQGMQTYFLKCLANGGGIKACIGIKIDFSSVLQYLTSIETASDKGIQVLERNPMAMSFTDMFIDVYNAAKDACEGNANQVQILLQRTSMDIIYSFFAYAMQSFYLAKTSRSEELSSTLIEEAKMTDIQKKLLSRLCKKEEFEVFFLQEPSTVTDFHMVSCLVDVLATVISAEVPLDSDMGCSIFLDTICDPHAALKRSIPGYLDGTDKVSAFGLDSILHGRFLIHFIDCQCGYRNVFKRDDIPLCPHCKIELPCKQTKPIPDTHVRRPQNTENVNCTETVRNIPQVVFRILQFISCSCLTGALALRSTDKDTLRTLLGLDEHKDVTVHFQEKLVCHWKCLKKLLSFGDEQLNRFMHIVLRVARPYLTNPKWHVVSKGERTDFEQRISEALAPLVKERYNFIKAEVAKFKEVFRDKGGSFLQDIVCEDFQEGKSCESLPCIWREVAKPNVENMKMEFVLTTSMEKFPLLSLILSYERELKLTEHIWNLTQWHRCTVKHFSYRYNKKDCGTKTLADFEHSEIENKDKVEKSLDGFRQSWHEITKMKSLLDLYADDIGQLENIHQGIELCKCIIVNKESQMYKVLEALIKMQNRILDEAMTLTVLHQVLSSSFLMKSNGCASVSMVKVEDIQMKQIVKEANFEKLLKFSQCDTRCGHGKEIVYDFYQIERDIAFQCLLNKAHLYFGDNFPLISFSGEIQHTTSSLLREIEELQKQEELRHETKHKVDDMKPADRKVFMNYLEMTFCLLKRTPVAQDGTCTVTDFLEMWRYLFPYKDDTMDDFCSTICLHHIVELYKLVEKHMASEVLESLDDKFRKDIPKEAEPEIILIVRYAVDSTLQAVVDALSKYAYRYLQSQDADPEEQLLEQLKDPSLWPKGVIERVYGTEQTADANKEVGILPPTIYSKHICHVVKRYREAIKEKSMASEVQYKRKQTRAMMSQDWKC